MYSMLAFVAGAMVGCMIFINGALASHVGAVEGSFVVHAVGLAVAWSLLHLLHRSANNNATPTPWWAYLGGFFGAVLVIITGVTVNSEIGVSGTVAMLLLGQILLGLVADSFGFFGLPVRRISVRDALQVLLVLAGSGLLLHG